MSLCVLIIVNGNALTQNKGGSRIFLKGEGGVAATFFTIHFAGGGG